MYLKPFLLALAIFLALDLVWITIIAKRLYRDGLGTLTRERPKWVVGSIMYPLLIVGLTFFVIGPALSNQSSIYAVLAGALFGLVAYGSYDLTNYATVKNWPLSISIIDMVWGMVVMSTTALLTYSIVLNLSS